MNTIKIVNTHSHVNTLKELNIDEALKNAQNENIITIVPSTSTEDIFEVDNCDTFEDIIPPKIAPTVKERQIDINKITLYLFDISNILLMWNIAYELIEEEITTIIVLDVNRKKK